MRQLRLLLPFAIVIAVILAALLIGLPETSTSTPVSQAQEDGDDAVVVTVEVPVTVEVTRIVTVVVTPTFTPPPPTPTALPPEMTIDDDHFIGAADAPVKIVEFSDYRCGFCGRFYQTTLYPLTEHYGDMIQFVYRDFPIFGDPSVLSALGAECAGDQDKFWEYHNVLFDSQTGEERPELNRDTLTTFANDLDLNVEEWDACLDSEETLTEVALDAQTAQQWGITGTPTFFINGKALVGAQPIEVFYQIIDAELRAQGIEPPVLEAASAE